MIQELDCFVIETFEDDGEEGNPTIAVCDMFPGLQGTGIDSEDAADDLAEEIADYLRGVMIH